jgi:uncharacterized protein YecE (DUF72 family)
LPGPLYIGTAGWSYPDWNGLVYPSKKPKGFDPLEFLTSYFNLIEINSTFYRLPTMETTTRWTERVSNVADFRFTVKAHQEFTHSKDPVDPRAVGIFKKSIMPILNAGRLLRVLVQFPWSFKDTAANRRRIQSLVGQFRPFPVAIELRHGSWSRGGAVENLIREGVSVCAVDQPTIGDSLGLKSTLPRTADATHEPSVYFRFHGRNKSEWFRRGTNRDLRYNYLYSRGELAGLADAVRGAAETAREVVVVLNNHFRGQAVANALELKSMLDGTKVAVPEPMLKAYPRLDPIALPDPNAEPEEGWLFDPGSPSEDDQ